MLRSSGGEAAAAPRRAGPLADGASSTPSDRWRVMSAGTSQLVMQTRGPDRYGTAAICHSIAQRARQHGAPRRPGVVSRVRAMKTIQIIDLDGRPAALGADGANRGAPALLAHVQVKALYALQIRPGERPGPYTDIPRDVPTLPRSRNFGARLPCGS